MLRWLKTRRRDRAIARAFGTPHPDAVTVLGGANPIAVNPRDGRVRKILFYDTARGRRKTNQVFWLDAVAAFEPSLLIDIGLNYGECLFSPTYPPTARLHGFEANPALLPYLRASLAGHPNADAITLHHNAVSDATGQTLRLAVDADWSGTSHLVDAASRDAVAVVSVRVDDAIPRPSSDDRLLFKIDIEGFEPPAIDGMLGTLRAAGSTLGFLEFSPELMASRGQDVPAFYARLAREFTLYACGKTGEATPLDAATFDALPESLRTSHCDLILVGGDRCEHADRFLTRWTQRAAAKRAA